jgi:hypothetical protein
MDIKDAKGTTVGICEKTGDADNIITRKMDGEQYPDSIVVELMGLDGPEETNPARAGNFSISSMSSAQPETHPSFVSVIMGYPGGDAFFVPLSPDEADRIAELRESAEHIRKEDRRRSN